jgi:hypothetical protein
MPHADEVTCAVLTRTSLHEARRHAPRLTGRQNDGRDDQQCTQCARGRAGGVRGTSAGVAGAVGGVNRGAGGLEMCAATRLR